MLDDFGSARNEVRLRRGKILPEDLLQFLRIGVTQFKKITDDVIALGNIRFVRDNGDAGSAWILSRADDLSQCRLPRAHKRVTVEKQIHLDDVDGFFARDRFKDDRC